MAEVTRDDSGKITRITYMDHAGYKAQVDPPEGDTGRVRITTTNKGGSGNPVDLERSEARKFFRDGLDLIGGEDD